MSEHSRAEKKAWDAFSKMIRERDEINGYFKCPTCGRTLPIDQADAGHYISRVHKAVKFDEMNVHAQCRHCNRMQEGNHFLYRKWLVNRFGVEAVEALEQRAQMRGGLKTVDLLFMADQFKKKTKELKEGKNANWS